MNRDARFAKSAFAVAGFPRWQRAEVALAGRSNAGKSSLLNALAGRRGLARISKTPGRTRAINFFTCGENLALVDLPGFGYAKMPREMAREIGKLMRDYLEHRRGLAALVLIIDARRAPEAEERALAELARERRAGLIVAAAKCDKLRRAERAAVLTRLAPLGVGPILCSAQTGEGIDELRRAIVAVARAAAVEHRAAR
jgi:GTP-binding protein